MIKKLVAIAVGISFIGLAGCAIRTPEIRGKVLDFETQQPVEKAWVVALLDISYKTIAGGGEQTLFVGKAWTDNKGEFVILPNKFEKPSFPVAFETKVDGLIVGARAITTKGFIKGSVNIDKIRKNLTPTILLTPPQNDEEFRSWLHTLKLYIETGRIAFSLPPFTEPERFEVLDLTIIAYERYFEKLGEPKTRDEKINYSVFLRDLAFLYLYKKNYEKSLEQFNKVLEFDRKLNVKLYLSEYEKKIQEIQEIIKDKSGGREQRNE